MKTLSLFTIFLTVNFFLASQGWGAETKETKEACESRAATEARKFCGDDKDCKTDGRKETLISEYQCGTKPSQNNASECRALAKEYKEARDKAAEECDRMEQTDSTAACLKKAQDCNNNMSTDPEDSTGFMNSAMGLFATIKNQTNGTQLLQQAVQIPEGCTLEDDDKEATSNERIQEKVQKLKEEIADLQKDQKDADKELADKKESVTEEIQKIQEDIDKSKTDRQNEDQKKAADIQKQTLTAQKEQTKAILDIEEKNRQINQVKLAAQAKILQYTDTNLLLACKSQIETKKAELIKSNKGKGSKGTSEIKMQLQAFADTCIASAKASRKQEIQTFQDKISQLNSDIAERNNDIKVSKQTIQQSQANIDALKKISDEAEQKELTMQQQKNAKLNQSLIDMEKYVKDKQATIQQKIDSKNQSMTELITAKLKKKPKYKKVISAADAQEEALTNYQRECCSDSKTGLCSDKSKTNSKAGSGGKR